MWISVSNGVPTYVRRLLPSLVLPPLWASGSVVPGIRRLGASGSWAAPRRRYI